MEQKTYFSEAEISIPAPVLSAKIDTILQAELSPLGFERIGPRRWVESLQPPLRRMFEFQARSGLTYCAHWGFSLDFVPTLRTGRLKWKRTPKTVRLDVSIDPVLTEDSRDWSCISCFIYPRKTYDWDKTERNIKSCVAAAKPDFSRVKTISNVVAVFQERSVMKYRGLTLENFIQTHIAWGLCLIAVGDAAEAEKHLDKFCTRFSIDRNDHILREAERQAHKIYTG